MRISDCLNVFVGLWLVPKYVAPSELGAVMPLTQFANFLAMPIAIFASAFRNELATLAANHRIGQVKTLMRGVFIATAGFLVLGIFVCRLILPVYLERIRVAEGSLGIVILLTSFVGAISPIYGNALQSLKKFKATSVISLLGAPVRLLTMLIALPFRALTGYFVGQSAVPVLQIAGAFFGLRKELSVPAEPYWTRENIRRIGRLLLIFGVAGLTGGIAPLVESTVLRQHLPDIDSAAYYMVSRFSDIATFLAAALGFALFPFAAELAAKGRDVRPLILKSSAAVFVTNAALAAFFCVFGRPLLAIFPHGEAYAEFWWAIPWIITIASIDVFSNFYTAAETAASRFVFMKWMIPLTLIYPALLVLVTEHARFATLIPHTWSEFISANGIKSLSSMLWWTTSYAVIKACCCGIAMIHRKPVCDPRPDSRPFEKFSATFCILARNCADNLIRNIAAIERMRALFGSSNVLVVENGSTDGTSEVLVQWRRNSAGVTLLHPAFPGTVEPADRIVRIAQCRRTYMDAARKLPDFDFLFVIDADTELGSGEIVSVLQEAPADWTALFANGQYYFQLKSFKIPICYYDLFAYLPVGSAKTSLQPSEMARESKTLHQSLRRTRYLPCKSAFGGLAIYKWSAARDCDYNPERTNDGTYACEHISFNLQLAGRGTPYICRKLKLRYERLDWQMSLCCLVRNWVGHSAETFCRAMAHLIRRFT